MVAVTVFVRVSITDTVATLPLTEWLVRYAVCEAASTATASENPPTVIVLVTVFVAGVVAALALAVAVVVAVVVAVGDAVVSAAPAGAAGLGLHDVNTIARPAH